MRMLETLLRFCQMVMQANLRAHGSESQQDIVKRFTTQYIPSEDRIQIRLETKSDGVQVLWVTRRLLNNLLPVLFKRFSLETINLPADNVPRVRAIQRFSQSAAVGKIKAQKPVEDSQSKPLKDTNVLVSAIDVKILKSSVELVFKNDARGKCFPIKFHETMMRQWLGILYSRYQVAGWRESFWPDWMVEDVSVSGGNQRFN